MELLQDPRKDQKRMDMTQGCNIRKHKQLKRTPRRKKKGQMTNKKEK